MSTQPEPAPQPVNVSEKRKLAACILATAAIVDSKFPMGLATVSPLHVLLELYLAEAKAVSLTADAIRHSGVSTLPTLHRWLSAIAAEGLIERNDGLLALTVQGHQLVDDTLEAFLAVQNAPD